MSEERTGPSVDQLEDAFPMIDRSQLETIREMQPLLTFRSAADVLDEAADQGKVPDEDYHSLASQASSSEQTLELHTDDPLDDEPDADPRSSHNEQRGQMALAHLTSTDYEGKARRAIERGSIRDEIELLQQIDKWANEALLDPNTASLPESAKEPLSMLGSDLISAVDDLAASGDMDALAEVETLAAKLNSSNFADRLEERAARRQEMLQSDGTAIDQVRQRVFDEDNSIGEMRRLQREAIENADITYEQAQALIEDVTEVIEEVVHNHDE